MIGNLDHFGPWAAGEDSRYQACARHEGALARMEYEDAWERAADCDECVADYRGRQ